MACFAPVATLHADVVYAKAAMLAQDTQGADQNGAVAALLSAAGNDRAALEEARRRYALRLHGRSDDWEATAALALLNRALATIGTEDPFDWRERWARHRKP
jgi:hypothetical protein